MRIVSVIVTDRSEGTILTVDSFGIFEEQLSDEVVEQAEKKYIDKCISNGGDEDDATDSLDGGWMELDRENIIVSIVWSDI